MNRICGRCGIFYKPKNPSNIRRWCPECAKEYYRNYRRERRKNKSVRKAENKQQREYQRKRRLNPTVQKAENKQQRDHYHANYYPRSEFQKKILCRRTLHYALGIGKIQKSKRCQKCKKITKLRAWHADYTKPLDIKWFCRDCWQERQTA